MTLGWHTLSTALNEQGRGIPNSIRGAGRRFRGIPSEFEGVNLIRILLAVLVLGAYGDLNAQPLDESWTLTIAGQTVK